MSQVRGLGHARPAPAASSGTSSASAGRTVTNPAIQLRTTATRRSQPRRARAGAGVAPAAREPGRHGSRVDRPVEVAEPVGQRRREVPAVGRLLGRVGRGDHGDAGGQRQVADRALEHDPQQRRLHGRRRGRDLVEERDAVAGLGQRAPPSAAARSRPARRRRRRPAARRSPRARGSRRSRSRSASRPRPPSPGPPRSCPCPGAPQQRGHASGDGDAEGLDGDALILHPGSVARRRSGVARCGA